MMTPKEQHDAFSRFATTCHEELEANMSKGGWDEDSPLSLMRRVREEMDEVETLMLLYGSNQFSIRALESECADVANMAMMVFDRTRRMLDETERLGVEPSRFHLATDPGFHEYWQRVYAAMRQAETDAEKDQLGYREKS